jgi:hypothetical protein
MKVSQRRSGGCWCGFSTLDGVVEGGVNTANALKRPIRQRFGFRAFTLLNSSIVQAGSTPLSHRRTSGFWRNPGATTAQPISVLTISMP